MRVLVCGSRDWGKWDAETKQYTDLKEMHVTMRVIYSLPIDAVIIHGAARGADYIAGQYAKTQRMAIQEYPAKWGSYGKAAGPMRNQQMLEEGKPDRAIAFTNDIENSKGTRDMVTRLKSAKIPTIIVDRNGTQRTA